MWDGSLLFDSSDEKTRGDPFPTIYTIYQHDHIWGRRGGGSVTHGVLFLRVLGLEHADAFKGATDPLHDCSLRLSLSRKYPTERENQHE